MLKLRAHHSGKFAPRENNPLYGKKEQPVQHYITSYNKVFTMHFTDRPYHQTINMVMLTTRLTSDHMHVD